MMLQFMNKKILHKRISENNQPAPQCLAKRKEKKTLTELPKLTCLSTQYTK